MEELEAARLQADYAKAHAISLRHEEETLAEEEARKNWRRRAYRLAHPKKTTRKITQAQYRAVLADAKENGDEETAAAAKQQLNEHMPRARLFKFTCKAGLRNNWQFHQIASLADYFEEGLDRLEALYSLPGFQYCFYRVSAEGNFLRGYIRFKEPKTETSLGAACSAIDFEEVKARTDLDHWVADPTLPACGKFYFSGVKPKRL